MQILLVSHVAPLRRSLQATLDRANHRVISVETFDEALKAMSVNL